MIESWESVVGRRRFIAARLRGERKKDIEDLEIFGFTRAMSSPRVVIFPDNSKFIKRAPESNRTT